MKNIFEKYKKSLIPTKEQEEKIYAKVFGELPKTNGRFNTFYFLIMNKKLSYGLITIALAVFVIAPFANFKLTDNQGYNPPETIATFGGNANQPTTLSSGSGEESTQGNFDSYDSSSTRQMTLIDPAPAYKGSTPEDLKTSEAQRAKEQTGSFTLECLDIKKTFEDAKSIASQFGGYVVSSNLSTSENSYGFIKIRIPADKFEAATNRISQLGATIVSEQIDTVDKQNELTEILKTKDSLDSQIKDLENKIANESDANKKADLQNQLNNLKSTQDYNNSQLNELNKDTLFSTIDISLKSKKFQLFSADLQSVPETFKYILGFWANLAVILIVPVVILVVGWKVVRRGRKS